MKPFPDETARECCAVMLEKLAERVDPGVPGLTLDGIETATWAHVLRQAAQCLRLWEARDV